MESTDEDENTDEDLCSDWRFGFSDRYLDYCDHYFVCCDHDIECEETYIGLTLTGGKEDPVLNCTQVQKLAWKLVKDSGASIICLPVHSVIETSSYIYLSSNPQNTIISPSFRSPNLTPTETQENY
jgi:hypothetical protein